MIENLFPVAESNSLRQVVVSVFSPQVLIDPKRFEEQLTTLNDYQKFELLKQNTFNFNFKATGIENKNTVIENMGFRFVSFEQGRLSKFFGAENREKDGNKYSIYSFTSLKYPQWDNFKKQFIDGFDVILNVDKPFIEAISLNYLNEFKWKSDDDIPISSIFNEEADFLSSKFFKSQNSTFLINTEEYNNDRINKSIEILEIVVSKSRQSIIVSSRMVYELVQPRKCHDDFTRNELAGFLDDIHEKIKVTLRTMFTDEIKNKINLQ